MIHVSIGMIFEWLLRNWMVANNITPNSTLIVFISFILVILFASITHVLVEKPGIILGKQIAQKIGGRKCT